MRIIVQNSKELFGLGGLLPEIRIFQELRQNIKYFEGLSFRYNALRYRYHQMVTTKNSSKRLQVMDSFLNLEMNVGKERPRCTTVSDACRNRLLLEKV